MWSANYIIYCDITQLELLRVSLWRDIHYLWYCWRCREDKGIVYHIQYHQGSNNQKDICKHLVTLLVQMWHYNNDPTITINVALQYRPYNNNDTNMEPTASTLQVHTVINCNKTVIFSSISFWHNSHYFGYFSATWAKIIISERTIHIQKTVSVPLGSVFHKVIWSTLQQS